MVKGTAKQAVVINPGEKSGFEQAIFIISGENDGLKIKSGEDLLRLADTIAAEHTVASLPASINRRRILPLCAAFALGALAACAALWLGSLMGL